MFTNRAQRSQLKCRNADTMRRVAWVRGTHMQNRVLQKTFILSSDMELGRVATTDMTART